MGRPNYRGVDLNRNFPDQYGTRGENRVQEAETLAVMQWIKSYPFVLSANLHGGSLVANYPYDDLKNIYSTQGQYSESPDDSVFKQLAESYSLVRNWSILLQEMIIFLCLVRCLTMNVHVIDGLIDWLIHWPIDCMLECSVDWLIDWLHAWLIDWLIDYLFALLFGWLIDWSTGPFFDVRRASLSSLQSWWIFPWWNHERSELVPSSWYVRRSSCPFLWSFSPSFIWFWLVFRRFSRRNAGLELHEHQRLRNHRGVGLLEISHGTIPAAFLGRQ